MFSRPDGACGPCKKGPAPAPTNVKGSFPVIIPIPVRGVSLGKELRRHTSKNEDKGVGDSTCCIQGDVGLWLGKGGRVGGTSAKWNDVGRVFKR